MGRIVPGYPTPEPKVIRTVDDTGKKAITLNVPQGIGDIFWVYQKFSPYFDMIHFNILVTSEDAVQVRAARWLDVLPKCGNIKLQHTEFHRYTHVIDGVYRLQDILNAYEAGQREFDYACNKPLENGVRLDEIDPGYEIETGVPIEPHECPLCFDEFVCGYVSGGTKDLGAIHAGCWTINRWCEFFMRLYKVFQPGVPLILIGASYDQDVLTQISGHLGRHGINNGYYIDSYPANVCYILKKAKCFIGYQSGLNILADNFDTKQVMLYFHKLSPMLYTWCKKENIKKKFFAHTFAYTPYEIINMLKAEQFTMT